jgi:hypothetical protein
MKLPSRAARLCVLVTTSLCALAPDGHASEPCPEGPDLQRVLDYHGAAALAEAHALEFVFTVEREGAEIVRRWRWDVPTGRVNLTTVNEDGAPELVTFQSPPPPDASADVLQVDRWFLNDRYWLLFPHRLAWDEGVTVTWECDEPLPSGRGTGTRFTAAYGAEGGYTPGDAYDFWAGPDGRVERWVFRRGGAAEPTLTVDFRGYASLGPLRLSLLRLNGGGVASVWFTDVTMTTAEGVLSPLPLE